MENYDDASVLDYVSIFKDSSVVSYITLFKDAEHTEHRFIIYVFYLVVRKIMFYRTESG